MHRQFFRIISENQEYVQVYCFVLSNPLKFAILQ